MSKLDPEEVMRQRYAAIDHYDRTRDALDNKLAELRKQCSHKGTVSYSPDPSGNNDSSYDCSACGASWRRLPEGVESND